MGDHGKQRTCARRRRLRWEVGIEKDVDAILEEAEV
jgi:hypothetical protein